MSNEAKDVIKCRRMLEVFELEKEVYRKLYNLKVGGSK